MEQAGGTPPLRDRARARLMNATALETSLMLTVEQIVEGDSACVYCIAPAVVTVANGADPEPEPVCLAHGLEWIDVTRATALNLFGNRG